MHRPMAANHGQGLPPRTKCEQQQQLVPALRRSCLRQFLNRVAHRTRDLHGEGRGCATPLVACPPRAPGNGNRRRRAGNHGQPIDRDNHLKHSMTWANVKPPEWARQVSNLRPSAWTEIRNPCSRNEPDRWAKEDGQSGDGAERGDPGGAHGLSPAVLDRSVRGAWLTYRTGKRPSVGVALVDGYGQCGNDDASENAVGAGAECPGVGVWNGRLTRDDGPVGAAACRSGGR